MKLTKDREFSIQFTLKIERYEGHEPPKTSWIIYRTNSEFLELDKILSKRFEPDYQQLFERDNQDYLSELKVHWE